MPSLIPDPRSLIPSPKKPTPASFKAGAALLGFAQRALPAENPIRVCFSSERHQCSGSSSRDRAAAQFARTRTRCRPKNARTGKGHRPTAPSPDRPSPNLSATLSFSCLSLLAIGLEPRSSHKNTSCQWSFPPNCADFPGMDPSSVSVGAGNALAPRPGHTIGI